MSNELEQAIADMSSAREIHDAWIRYYDGTPEALTATVEQGAAIGDVEWHRVWVEKYDRVLRVLQSDRL